MVRRILVLGTLFLLMFAGAVPAQVSVQDSVAKYMAIGDALADKWDHAGAAEAYKTVLSFDPNDYEAAWKTGDRLTDLADKLPAKEKAKKEAMFEEARQSCAKAITIDPKGYEGHLRMSVALGRLALFRGGKEKINMSKMVKAEVDTAIGLNPESGDLAYHVLGRWHQNLANLSGMLKFAAKILYGGVPPGTNEEAVTAFKKAIQINPTHIEHYLELARTYQYMGKKDLMKEPLQTVLSLPNKDQDDPVYKTEAEAMLKKLK
jgi:tetratricopeptide (TPR) repeat protein